MGLAHSVVSELKSESRKISHPTPNTLVQSMTGGDVLWYVVYRFLMAGYITGSFLHGFINNRLQKNDPLSLLHFATWGYIVTVIQANLLACCTLANYNTFRKRMRGKEAASRQKKPDHAGAKQKEPDHAGSKQKEPDHAGSKQKEQTNNENPHHKRRMTFSISLSRMPKTHIVIWVAHYIMLYSSLVTLIMYEVELFRGRLLNVIPHTSTYTPYQVLLHEVFFVYCIIDFFVCGIPIRLLHFYVMTIYSIVYHLIMLIITIAFSRTAENYRPIYDVMDFQAQRVTLCALFFVSQAFFTPLAVHVLYYGLFLLKVNLVELYFQTTRVNRKPKRSAIDAASTPEEKRASEWTPEAFRSRKIVPISEQEEIEMSSLNKEQNLTNTAALSSTLT